jgi:hypothetical protein
VSNRVFTDFLLALEVDLELDNPPPLDEVDLELDNPPPLDEVDLELDNPPPLDEVDLVVSLFLSPLN